MLMVSLRNPKKMMLPITQVRLSLFLKRMTRTKPKKLKRPKKGNQWKNLWNLLSQPALKLRVFLRIRINLWLFQMRSWLFLCNCLQPGRRRKRSGSRRTLFWRGNSIRCMNRLNLLKNQPLNSNLIHLYPSFHQIRSN